MSNKKRSFYDIVVNGVDYKVTIGDQPVTTVCASTVYKAVSKALSKRFPTTYNLQGLHFVGAINNVNIDSAQYDYCYTARGKRKHVLIIVTCDKSQFTNIK